MPDGFFDIHSWWLTGARLESASMRRYYEAVRTAIHDGEDDFRQRIRAEVDDDYREHLAEGFMERFETYPKMLRYSQVVAIANTIEHELRTLAEMCEGRTGTLFDDFRRATDGWPREFGRVHNYLIAELGFQLPNGQEWEFLMDSFILRNAIAHFDGRTDKLSGNQAARALAFANGQPNVSVNPRLMADGTLGGGHHAVEFEPAFIEDLFATWERWLGHVERDAGTQGFSLP